VAFLAMFVILAFLDHLIGSFANDHLLP